MGPRRGMPAEDSKAQRAKERLSLDGGYTPAFQRS